MGGNDQSDVHEEIDDDTDLFEIIIFSLSPVLGGRSEVMATPFYETLKHLELHEKKKKSDRWNSFMDAVYSTLDGVDGNKRMEYIKTIQPEQARKKLTMKTDLNQLEQLLKEQEERAKSNQGG